MKSLEEFIEENREQIEDLMSITGMDTIGFNYDQEEIETFIMSNEDLYNLAIKEGVEI